MSKWRDAGLFFIIITTLISSKSYSLDLIGSVGLLPIVAESEDKGVLVSFLKSMQKAYPEGSLKFKVQPFKRSMDEAINGNIDFHGPILKHPNKSEKELGFRYSKANIWNVVFALYTNSTKPGLDLKNLGKYNIETDAAHVGFFDFKINPSSCIECSLKKLAENRIDGFIFAAMESDAIIEKKGLRNIRSARYKEFEGKFVVPLTDRGHLVDIEIEKIVNRLKESGEDKKCIGIMTDYYRKWKPRTY